MTAAIAAVMDTGMVTGMAAGTMAAATWAWIAGATVPAGTGGKADRACVVMARAGGCAAMGLPCVSVLEPVHAFLRDALETEAGR